MSYGEDYERSTERHPESKVMDRVRIKQVGVQAQQGSGESKTSSVSVIIPTYNEGENIGGVIRHCCEALSAYDYEIIVVDDDSPDKTWKVVRRIYEDESSVRVIRRREEVGLATAISRGFRESTKDVYAVIDGDHQHPPEKLPDLIDALDSGADIAIGSRYIEGGGLRDWSLFRRYVSLIGAVISKLGLPEIRDLSDPMSGFFAVRQDLIDGENFDPVGYKMLLEVLMKCDYESIAEVPYVFSKRENGNSNLTPGECVRFIRHILLLRAICYKSNRWFLSGAIGQFLRKRY